MKQMTYSTIVNDTFVQDEIARIYTKETSNPMEDAFRGEIIDWLLATPKATAALDMKQVIQMFWNERLS